MSPSVHIWGEAMKEQIYTIPVNDAYNEDKECPICSMRRTLEEDAISFTLGPSYMEDDVRAKTDKLGFCQKHIDRLYREKNSLGLALILKTHFDHVTKEVQKRQKPMKPASFFKKQQEKSELVSYLEELNKSCFVCSRIDQFFYRYIDTIFYLYQSDEEFRQKTENCKGYCNEHYGLLMEQAPSKLKGDQLNRFVEKIGKCYLENMLRVKDDLEWFTDKFDYRYKDAPWKNSKDAIPRAITKTNGIIPADETTN